MKSKFNKRCFLILFAAAIFGTAISLTSFTSHVHAEEAQVAEDATVVIKAQKGGDIIVDVLEGHAGDKATARVAPNVLYKIESVKVNGTNITANEDGNYEFILVAGENTIEAAFVVDNAELATIASILTDAKNQNWENIFNLNNLFALIWGIVSVVFSSGFFITLIKSKKIKAKTIKEIEEGWNNVVGSKLGDTIGDFLKDTIQPLIEKYNIKIENLESAMKTLSRCFALAQENTPEARLAIINELTEFKSANKEITEEVKKIINNEIEKNNKDKEELNKAIEELKAANNEIQVENTSEDNKESGVDRYGQI